MLISHSRWRTNKENQLVRKYIERKNMEIIKKIRQQLVEIKHNSRLLTYLWYVCRMPKFKHGLMPILFPVIMMANIHGQDLDIPMTGQIMDRHMVCLNSSLNRTVM